MQEYSMLLDRYYRLLDNPDNLEEIHSVSCNVHRDVHDEHNE